MRKGIFLLLFFFTSSALSQQIIGRSPLLGTPINWSHLHAKGLVGMWLTITSGSGDKAYDLSLNGNDGTLTNMVPLDDWVTGRDGYALDFDGSDDYINIADSDELDLSGNNFTIAVWCRLTGGAGFRWLVTKDDGNNGSVDYLLGVSSNNAMRFLTRGLSVDIIDPTAFPTNEWVFVVGVQAFTESLLYINGEEVTSEPIAGSETNNAEPVRIGARGGGPVEFWVGQIGSVVLNNRAWTAEEVKSRFINFYAMFEQPPGRILAVAAPPAGGEDKAIFNIIIGKNETKKRIFEQLSGSDSLYVSLDYEEN